MIDLLQTYHKGRGGTVKDFFTVQISGVGTPAPRMVDAMRVRAGIRFLKHTACRYCAAANLSRVSAIISSSQS